jgi:hypothetical protein
MTQNSTILQELKELESSLAGLATQNIYSVPDGYFEGLAGQVLNRIKATEAANAAEELGYLSPMLSTMSKMSKQLPFTVPAGYFEGLEEKLMQTVRDSNDYQTATEELETLSPLLSGLKKEMPYSVPQGYFENLGADINTQGNKTETKVVSIGSRKWFRYAAAAVITGVIIMAGFLYFNNNSDNTSGGKVMAKFTRDVKKMDETQKDDLIDFIDAGMNGNETAEVNTEIKSKEVKQLLQDISDEELKDFQEQTEDIEDVLMTN